MRLMVSRNRQGILVIVETEAHFVKVGLQIRADFMCA